MDERLRCGTPIDALLTQVSDHTAPDDAEHQRHCATCQATLLELRSLWSPLEQLAAEPVSAPSGLLETVMDKVRSLPRNSWHAVIHAPHGETRISARVVAAVARLAAQQVPDVSLALGRGRTGEHVSPKDLAGRAGEQATDVGVAGTHVILDVQVVVRYGTHIPDLAANVRRHVADHIAAHTGLTATAINVTVVDVTVV